MTDDSSQDEQSPMFIIVSFAIVVVFLFVLLIIAQTSREAAKTAADTAGCKASVDAIAASRDIIDRGSVPSIKCSTTYTTVESSDPNAKKQAIASAMATCWDNFGRGQKDIFDTETGNYCVVCSRLEFSDDKPINGLGAYLLTRNKPGTGKSYLSFLWNKDLPLDAQQRYEASSLAFSDSILSTQPLAVVFVQSKKIEEHTTQATVIGGSIGVLTAAAGIALSPFTLGASLTLTVAGVGAVTGGGIGYFVGTQTAESQIPSGIALWPYDDMQRLNCYRLEGRGVDMEFVS